jgi:hypothetical protein
MLPQMRRGICETRSAIPHEAVKKNQFSRPVEAKRNLGFRVCVRTANFRIHGGSPRIYAGEGALQRSGKQSRLDHAL